MLHSGEQYKGILTTYFESHTLANSELGRRLSGKLATHIASQQYMNQDCPAAWFHSEFRTALLRAISERKSVLMLDYDGTLAPFTRERLRAVPYPGIAERISRLQRLPSTRVVLITGRPAEELRRLIDLPGPFEIWGSHGREHLTAAGEKHIEPLTPEQENALNAIAEALDQHQVGNAMERKPASIALHWRGLDPEKRTNLQESMRKLYLEKARPAGLDQLLFDGGIEIRSADIHKGTVIDHILQETPQVVAAYLGDDTTDEDAFQAIKGRGTGVLVRAAPRASAAEYWLRPPEELRAFLDDWIAAAGGRAEG